ncbi:hypothetical protein J4E93_005701 [Alternaria ventricosa]|uniref:uncharacterized protein n=1 Tax=Alternaria ventricosa TaxID=1187951 RepID=UPI0020C46580|nr:uncharacterized protein J4E93_005701 [Alternaria ventricosa]KAI4644903.1 hypothetical protein J4E93_005701 [Alternaria ventricosa]
MSASIKESNSTKVTTWMYKNFDGLGSNMYAEELDEDIIEKLQGYVQTITLQIPGSKGVEVEVRREQTRVGRREETWSVTAMLHDPEDKISGSGMWYLRSALDELEPKLKKEKDNRKR